MIDRLLGVLGDLPFPVTAEEVCDAIWLARHLPPGRLACVGPVGPAGPLGLQGSASHGPPTEPEWPVPDADATSACHMFTGQVREELSGPAALAYQPAAKVAATSKATVTTAGMPAVSALPGIREINRALRPFRRRYESPVNPTVDEVATAAAIADSGLWYPQLRPGMQRWLNLTLIVDDSESMVVWQQTISELRVLLERLGAFRDLRTWRFDGDLTKGRFPQLRGESGQQVQHRQLLQPGGRQLILLISDCVGAAWTFGSLARLLEELSGTALVAVLQPLPQWLWARCRPPFTPVEFHAAETGLAGRRVTAVARDPADAMATGTAIPVLELEPEARWLAPWASLLAQSGSAPGVALFTRAMTGPDAFVAADNRESASAPDEPSAFDRLLSFRAASSPTAYELAGYLAAAPLSLPVMRLVQVAMLPKSRPAHLAEIFLGGLLRRADSDAARQHSSGYDFYDGVRDLLIAGLSRADTMRVLRETLRFVSARLGSPTDFPALLADADKIADLGPPFARVAYTALRALGGRYADVAAKLEVQLNEDHQGLPRPSGASESAVPAPVPVPASAPPNALESKAELGNSENGGRGPRVSQVGSPSHILGGDVTYPSPGPRTGHEQEEQPRVFHGVPRRNPNFTGRNELLDELRGDLSRNLTALLPEALHGLGGVGKTQLAIEFAHRFAADYELVWWIKAEELSLVRASLVDLAHELGITPAGDTGTTVRAVLDALRQGRPYRRWLLVYDNADDPDELQQYLPEMCGHVLVTSRNRKWRSAAKTIHVDVFSRQESIDLIRLREPKISMDAAARLADRLGDLPLAIEQAAAWQGETGMSVDTYLELFEKAHERLLAENLPPDYPNSVAVTWRVGFEQLMTVSPAAAQLLQLSAFFGPEPISIHVLAAGQHVADLPTELAAAMQDTFLLHTGIRDIGRYALASADSVDESLQVHPLVQLVLRDRIPPQEQEHQRALVHQLLAAANPSDPDNRENWPRLAEINLHIVRSVGMIEGKGDNVRQVIVDQIRYLYVRGDYESSRSLGESTMLVWWDMYDPNDALTLMACRQLGNSWRALGMTDVARAYNKDTLDRTRRVFGEDDQRSLEAANSYGADLRIDGELQAARELDEENLERHKRVLGPEKRATLRCENNLAVDMRLGGDFKDALDLDQDIYQRRLNTLGAADQETLFSRCMVARDLRGCGQYREALDLYDRVLAQFSDLLGHDHQDVLNARLSYGVTLQRAGQYARARAEVEEVLADFRGRFGADHPGSVAAMTILAGPLRQLGDIEGARRLAEQALALARRVHGSDHVFTLPYANNLAIALRSAGQLAEALRLDEETFHGFKEGLGEDHVFTLSSAANYAHSLYLSGSFAAAKALSMDTLERSIRVRGEDNPLTQLCACNLAIDLRQAGEVAEADELVSHAVERLSALLGPESPEKDAAATGKRHNFDIEPPQL